VSNIILSTSKTGLQAAATVIHKLGVRCNIAARQTTSKPTRDRSSAIFERRAPAAHTQLPTPSSELAIPTPEETSSQRPAADRFKLLPLTSFPHP